MSLSITMYTNRWVAIIADKRETCTSDLVNFTIKSDDAVKVIQLREDLFFELGSCAGLAERYGNIMLANRDKSVNELIEIASKFNLGYYFEKFPDDIRIAPISLTGRDDNGRIFYWGRKHNSKTEYGVEYPREGKMIVRVGSLKEDVEEQIEKFLLFQLENEINPETALRSSMMLGAYLNPEIISPTVNMWFYQLKK